MPRSGQRTRRHADYNQVRNGHMPRSCPSPVRWAGDGLKVRGSRAGPQAGIRSTGGRSPRRTGAPAIYRTKSSNLLDLSSLTSQGLLTAPGPGIRPCLWRLSGLPADRQRFTQPVRDRFPLPARAGRTGEVLLGVCQCSGQRDGECRLALPQQHAHVGSVFPGSLSFGPRAG